MTPKWYLMRLASMSPSEIIGRTEDAGRRRIWKYRTPAEPVLRNKRRLPVVPEKIMADVDPTSKQALLAEAERLLDGRLTMFGRERTDVTADVDYFVDFVNGTRAPDSTYSFEINHRHEDVVGNVKFVWELGRHQHLTMLAAAYALSGDQRFADRIDTELRNFWNANPFLVGIHWTSGIEIGLRLISWTWIRRLLDSWDGAAALFENNEVFIEQLGRHQQWLAKLSSHGSSANNHLIAEACGQYVASSAFGLFDKSDRWRQEAGVLLADELRKQTFEDGLNKELASDYHGFVLEMALSAWIEAVLSGDHVAAELAEPIAGSLDALHAVVDRAGQPHHQGDSDDAHGWLVDPIGYNRWASLLRTAKVVVAPAHWWIDPDAEPASGLNAVTGDVRTGLLTRCAAVGGWTPAARSGLSEGRPSQFAGAGLTILRDLQDSDQPELWCMIDHGPHGFLSTAAHAHADALAIEIRCDGVEIVADPGTYCYHGEPEWRDYFRSTVAHATVGLDGADQSEMGGPFLWTRKAESRLESHAGLLDGERAICVASHDGYTGRGATHRRRVELDRDTRAISVIDDLIRSTDGEAGNSYQMTKSYPLGPAVEVELSADGTEAALRWPTGLGQATVSLDKGFSWSIESGSISPPMGWYSAHFGTKEPCFMLIGSASSAEIGVEYKTVFQF